MIAKDASDGRRLGSYRSANHSGLVLRGAQKLLGWFGGHGLSATLRTFRDQLGIPMPLAYLAIAAEFFGGLGLIVGFLSRIAAVGIAITMVMAMVMVHLKYGFFINWFGDKQGHGIEYHLLAIALAAIVIVHGAGAFSLDRALYRRMTSPDNTALELDSVIPFFGVTLTPVKRLCFDEEFSCRRFHGVGNCHRL